jgi:hypothetical protein
MTEEQMHRHNIARTTIDRPFFHCVAPYRCDERAHGGIVYEQICSCGARRTVAQNRQFAEYSPWRPTKGE